MVELYSKYQKDLISLANISKITQDELADALKNPYNTIFIPKKHNKKEKRPVDIPHDFIKPQTTVLNKLFRQIPCPAYNYAGYEGRNAYQNAKAHIGNFAYVTMDIKSYYPNTKAKYVYELLVNKFGICEEKDKEQLDFLMKILTFNGHVPTGAPTSPIIAFLAHKDLFDEIYEYTKALGIVFTLYYDDITLSAKHSITMEVVKHIEDILAKHELKINPKKTIFYSYKKAHITGYYIHQSGKISIPYHFGHDVVKMLDKKRIKEMSKKELNRLIGKINHIQYIDKKAFKTVKSMACRQLGKLVKAEERK